MSSERRLSFGRVADAYDRARPSYPEALVDDVLAFASAGAGDRALEVGAGTGKATVPFAARGLSILALEPSAEMAQLARRNCARYRNVEVEVTEFERWTPERGAFRLVFSAQAWHWIEPQVRYSRARSVLARRGALAVFWNRPRWEGNPLRDGLHDVYRRAAPELAAGERSGWMNPGATWDPSRWGDRQQEIRDAPGFGEAEVRSYSWNQEYTTEQYLRLLGTASENVVLEPERREALFDAVAAVIDDHGGSVALEYVTLLYLGRALGGAEHSLG